MAEEFKKRQEELQKLVLEFELQVKNNINFYYDSEYYERIVKWYIDNHKFNKIISVDNYYTGNKKNHHKNCNSFS